MNKVFLIGNLTRDPELSTTSGGVKFCRFTLAVSRSYSKDGKRETDFLPVVVWRAQADNCARYLQKGRRAAVSGPVQTRTYAPQAGSRRYVTEIAADEVQFLSTRSEEAKEDSADFDDLTPIDDDLPF